jgi:tRNA U34 5-carboxymethylaminomethyl modifying GTPase MnmE/TrmE
MMDQTPKGNRLQIALFGRMNVGKSSLLNMIAGQDYAITSPVAGTTTDVVEKTMELLWSSSIPPVSTIPRAFPI